MSLTKKQNYNLKILIKFTIILLLLYKSIVFKVNDNVFFGITYLVKDINKKILFLKYNIQYIIYFVKSKTIY